MSHTPANWADDGADADRQVLARMAAGDAGALAELYDMHARMVYSLALRIVRDQSEAEDVVQDVFAQAWRQAIRYDPDRATVIGWLLMITRARSIDRVRARRPDATNSNPLPDVPSVEPSQEAIAVTRQTAIRVRAALGELGESLRTPIEMAYYEGLSQRMIAERLGEPLGTIKSRMRTALSHLRSVLRTESS